MSRGMLEALRKVYKADALVERAARRRDCGSRTKPPQLDSSRRRSECTALRSRARSSCSAGSSLFTDAATEAIYPLLPVFVTRVLGGPPVALGIVEGAADAISSVLKIVAGRWSDRIGRRKPLVVAGYALSSAGAAVHRARDHRGRTSSLIRVADRVGKGLRGAPRDAMLAALAPPGERGRVFGYHCAMDHAGAVSARCWRRSSSGSSRPYRCCSR